ncbi:cell division-specific peptidoglycan biosynthesis regulator FtsW [Marininema mesophilum]|uniref:Probable peptidoglycan glycosyltransferase FtsW n=1 Tax=Marininema mesophilum TaxID=1048340 RepID=A0A1H2QZL3_9BACL|nr:putative lipid II flippase FtsW [Marininema mesophilum]SDW12652.1 cell division-specific peptidoglycan biosynthesis regulator FtsW [Marininema mesophilum]
MRGKPDFWMMLIIFLLTGFGLVMVFSSSYYDGLTKHADSYYFFKKQLSWSVIALILFFVIANVPYTFYQKKVGLILLGSLFLLLLVYIPGISDHLNGASRWIRIGPVGFQPSELAKIAAIIYTAAIMTKKQSHLHNFKRGLLPPFIILGLFSALIVSEPHFSSMVILLVSCMTVMFIAGARMKHLLLLLSTGIPVLVYIMLMEPYRLKRWSAVFDPWQNPTSGGFQIIQSLFAIGPGGLMGKGLGNSIQKLAYLPMAQTDFIFSIIAEELGFIGGVVLIALYIAFILRGIRIAVRAPDLFGHLLGIGIVTMFAIQTLFNLGVVTAMLPVTGIPLPFISYGGTSLVICMMAAGILMNISRYQTTPSSQKQTSPTNRSNRKRPQLVTFNFKG